MSYVVAKAYEIFSGYNVNLPLDVCTECCMKTIDAERLSTYEVSDIPLELLMEYNDQVSSGNTQSSETKHFLPRYLELVYSFDFPSHSLELTFRRMEPFLAEDWTNRELLFLKEFSAVYFDGCVSQYPLPDSLMLIDVLIMLWKKPFSPLSLLEAWRQDKSVSSMLHFKDLWYEGFKSKRGNVLLNTFATREISKEVKSWLDERATIYWAMESIENIIMNNTSGDKENEQLLSNVYNTLAIK